MAQQHLEQKEKSAKNIKNAKRRSQLKAQSKPQAAYVPVSMLYDTLKMIRDDVPPDQSKLAVAIAGLEGAKATDFNLFEQFYAHYQRLELQKQRKNAGYSHGEIDTLRKKFRNYDWDGDETIAKAELRQLLQDLFPDATRSVKQREHVRKLLHQVDADGSNALSFSEFLWLMRAVDDEKSAVEVEEDDRMVIQLGLCPKEVEEFRDIFNNKPECVERLIATAAKQSERNKNQELALLARLSPCAMSFSKFLQLANAVARDSHSGGYVSLAALPAR